MPSSSSSRWRPLLLVIVFGVLMGSIPGLVKLDAELGVPAATFATLQAGGAGLLVLILCAVRHELPSLRGRHLRYHLIAGLTGIALPNQLLFMAVPHIGAGLAALSYGFPTLMTLLLALAVGMERLDSRRCGGLLLGFGGALMIGLSQGGAASGGLADNPWWGAAAMACPMSLAFGNVYRSRDWPPGAKPGALAAGMLLSGALWLVPLTFSREALEPALTGPALAIEGLTIALTAIAYLLFLELQRIAGPVYLSQVGYIITATGLVIGTGILGERYDIWVWLSILAIFGGLGLTSWSSIRAATEAHPDRGRKRSPAPHPGFPGCDGLEPEQSVASHRDPDP